jgi:hypothetical protein
MGSQTLPVRYVVTIARTYRSSIVFLGTKDEAIAEAKRLNEMYQTDGYKVEELDL